MCPPYQKAVRQNVFRKFLPPMGQNSAPRTARRNLRDFCRSTPAPRTGCRNLREFSMSTPAPRRNILKERLLPLFTVVAHALHKDGIRGRELSRLHHPRPSTHYFYPVMTGMTSLTLNMSLSHNSDQNNPVISSSQPK